MLRTSVLCTIVAAGAMTLAGGCAGYEHFRPTERATAVSPEGYSAADYDFETDEGELGEVKVWSDGAMKLKYRGRKSTYIHVGFDVENDTDEPLRLATDNLYLDTATVDEAVFENVAPSIIDGPTMFPPNQAKRVDVYFAMPRGVDPDDVDAFRVRWALRDDGKQLYGQWTPFIEFEPSYYAGSRYYYSPFYDPFYYSPAYIPPAWSVWNHPYYYPWYY